MQFDRRPNSAFNEYEQAIDAAFDEYKRNMDAHIDRFARDVRQSANTAFNRIARMLVIVAVASILLAGAINWVISFQPGCR